MIWKLMALLVLAVFYAIYFIKMWSQSKRGIQTRQIGKRKEKDIRTIERWMSVATLCAPAAQVVSIFTDWSWLPDSARFTGFLTGLIGDGIFLIAVVTMKNSWRAGIPESDRTELITSGIYRYSRNPAFLGFDFMYVGVCLMFCNPATIVFSLFAAVMLHLQILQEEKYLTATFGDTYVEYKRKVFRYLGRSARV